MVSLADISRRGALPALTALARSHPKPLGAMEFARASGADPGTAGRVRDELQELGLITATVVRQQGAVREHEIRLTNLGREIGSHLVALDDIFKRAERRAERAR